jgi:phage terminase large subunit GpA-like protein
MVVPRVDEDGKAWSKDHFDTMVRDCECLHGRVQVDISRDKRNTILHKSFTGGILYIIGAVSAAGFRQKTIRYVFLDDVDGYELTAGEEGDQIALARKRTLTYKYHGRKIVKVSTPTSRDLSRIEKEFKRSDQRFYYVQCPQCHHFMFLRFSEQSQFAHLGTSKLWFDRENLSWIYYPCENCNAKLIDKDREWMIRNGKWQITHPEVKDHAGFHISEMFSPFSDWKEIAKDFMEAKHGGRETLRVFVNQTLGETFIEDKQFELNDDDLRRRVEEYEKIPAGTLTMTASVDVHGDRLEVEVQGWGKEFENWHIYHYIIYGAPQKIKTWEALDEFLLRYKFEREDGIDCSIWTDHGINCVVIDSGDEAEHVYRYVKRWQERRVYAIKGKGGHNEPFIINVKYEKRYSARYTILGVDSIKTTLMDRLSGRIKETDDGKRQIPAGYYHFNKQCGQEFFEQLLSEKRAVIRNRKTGASKITWIKKRDRNEIWDLYVYNLGAITLLKPDFEALAEKLEAKLSLRDETPEQAEERKQEEQKKPIKRKTKNWIRDY